MFDSIEEGGAVINVDPWESAAPQLCTLGGRRRCLPVQADALSTAVFPD